MSLHDVNKNELDRSSPQPNHTDRLNDGSIKAHGTNSVNYITDATTAPSGGTNTGTGGGGTTVVAGFKRLVQTCPVAVVNNGGTLTTAVVAHNLPFVPVVEASLDNATVGIASGSVTGATVPLPIFTTADLSTSNDIKFGTWLYAFADATNMYVNMLNTTGSPVSVTVTCYLYQRVKS